jgi:oligopeptide transport system ATP-binding protein
LDATVQAGILRLLDRLRRERGLAVLIITHDLGVLSAVADDICVMYGGRMVECGPRAEVLAAPQHPYTMALLDALPHPDSPGSSLRPIPGSPPALGKLPPGCAFEPRCRFRVPACAQHRPELIELSPGHQVACALAPVGSDG